MFTLWLEYFIYLFFFFFFPTSTRYSSPPSPFFFLSPPSSTCRQPKPLPSANRLKPTPPSASDPHRQSPPILWIEVASLNSTSSLGRDCAPVCVGIGVEIDVWFKRLGSWIWVWWVSAFGLLDFRGHCGDGGGGGG